MTHAENEDLTREEIAQQSSEAVPERELMSTVAGGWMGMATAGDVAAEPSPVDDVYTIQLVTETEE